MTPLIGQSISPDGQLCASLTAYEVVAEIVAANPEIESLTLVAYDEGPNWPGPQKAEEKDALPVLLKGLRQDTGERVFFKLSRPQINAIGLRSFTQGLKPGQLCGVISKVSLANGESRHIPMMDFLCTPSSSNLEVLTRLIAELNLGRGYLLESGRSYHYYGLALQTQPEWLAFLGKFLLMSGYVDNRYVGHQLVDGHCVLRLSAGKLKTKLPNVVAEFPRVVPDHVE